MEQGKLKAFLLSSFMLAANLLLAQDGNDKSPNYLLYILLAVVVIVVFAIIIQLSENMLAIEARRVGADRKGVNYGIIPRMAELFAKKAPAYVGDSAVKMLKKGYNILLEGEPKETIDTSVRANTYAVQPMSFIGMSPIPKLLVKEGDTVKAGDLLFFDKARPEIKYPAPVSGEVIAVTRGDRRAILDVVILADKDIQYRELPACDPDKCSREELVSFLLESGAWPLIRQRPYDIVADPQDVPRDIFISTFDTAPLAPNLDFVVAGRGEAFQKGLDVLGKLTSGKVHLGLNAGRPTAPSSVFTEAQGVEKHWFAGKHPAGNVSVHIHHVNALRTRDRVWVLGVQDVITIGALFTEKRFNAERVVALTGAELKETKYVRTYIGANIGDLIKDNLANDHVRFISGDVLSGKQKPQDQFLDFYDDQLTVVKEGDDFELFGWLLALEPRPSVSRAFPNVFFPNERFQANTNTRGEKRAFVVTGQFEELLPMAIYPQHLMKAIIVGDIEQMEGLGIHELVEEDVALCEFACTSKQPLQQILREGLDVVRAEG